MVLLLLLTTSILFFKGDVFRGGTIIGTILTGRGTLVDLTSTLTIPLLLLARWSGSVDILLRSTCWWWFDVLLTLTMALLLMDDSTTPTLGDARDEMKQRLMMDVRSD